VAGTTYPSRAPEFTSGFFLERSVLLIFLNFVLLWVFTFWAPCCDIRYNFRIRTVFGSSLPSVVCRMPQYLIYVICVCLRTMISNTCCVVFVLFSSSMLPVFLDCLFLISPSVFYNVYWLTVTEWYVLSSFVTYHRIYN